MRILKKILRKLWMCFWGWLSRLYNSFGMSNGAVNIPLPDFRQRSLSRWSINYLEKKITLQKILIVLMVVLVVTPCFAQEIEPNGLSSFDEIEWSKFGIFPFINPYEEVYLTSLWEYSCSPPTGDFDPLFEDILNGGMGFNIGGVFEAFWENEECHFVVNYQSDVIFEIVNFMPIVFFEFEERYGDPVGLFYEWSYHHQGVVFPLLNVGILYIWMDASPGILQFDEVLNCSMTRQDDPRGFGFCTSYVYY